MTMESDIADFAAQQQKKSRSFLMSWFWVNILYLFPSSLTAPLWDLLFPDLEGSLWGFIHDWAIPFIGGNLLALLFIGIRILWYKKSKLSLQEKVPFDPYRAIFLYVLPFALAMSVDIAIEAWWTVPPADRADYDMGSTGSFIFTYGMEFLVFWAIAILLTVLTDSCARLIGAGEGAFQQRKEKLAERREQRALQPVEKFSPFRWIGRAVVCWVKFNICYIIPGALIWPLWGFFMGDGALSACLGLWLAGCIFGNIAALVMLALCVILWLLFRGLVRGFGYQLISKPDASPLQIEVRRWFLQNVIFILPSALLVFCVGTGIFSLQSRIGDWDWGAPLGRTFFICLVFWGVCQVASYFAARLAGIRAKPKGK